MSDQNLPFDGKLLLSRHLDYFRHGEDFYVYHNLFSYILKMSEDVLHFLEFFRGEPKDAHQALEAFKGQFDGDLIAEFANVFAIQRCLIDPEDAEENKLRPLYPVHGKWTVYHQPESGPVTLYAVNREDNSQIHVITLDDWESALWRKIDGETSCAQLIEAMREHPESPVTGLDSRVFASLANLINADLQFLKVSPKPMSEYAGKKRHSMPPFLNSTMPYEKITEQVRGEGSGPRVSAGSRTTVDIDSEKIERDLREHTLSFIFRDPHDAIDGGRSYGGALIHHALGLLGDDAGEGLDILEVGGRNNVLSRSILDALRDDLPERYAATRYTLIVSDEALADDARALLEAASHAERVTLVVQERPDLEAAPGGPYDVFICNEIAAELETVPVRKIAADVPEDDEEEEEDEETGARPTNGKHAGRDIYLAEGDVVSLIFRQALPLTDAPPDFFLNTGAITLIEQAGKALAPNAVGLLVEFGELYDYPKRVTQDGLETYSMHFGHLTHVARRVGFDTHFDFVMTDLNFDRDAEVLVSTRSHFAALRQLLAAHDIDLTRRPFTPDEWRAFLEDGDLEPESVHDITYDTLDNRVLGILPHSFKLLSFRRSE